MESRMNTTNIKTRISKTLAGVALAAALMIAVGLPSAANADGPNRPVSSQQLTIMPADGWLYGPPYFEMHPGTSPGAAKVASETNLRIIPADGWLFGPPYFEMHPGMSLGAAKVAAETNLRIIPDDAWLFGPPYFETHFEANAGAATAKLGSNSSNMLATWDVGPYEDIHLITTKAGPVGYQLGTATVSAPANVKPNTRSAIWNDDFSLVYGIPDIGLELVGASVGEPGRLLVDPGPLQTRR